MHQRQFAVLSLRSTQQRQGYRMITTQKHAVVALRISCGQKTVAFVGICELAQTHDCT